VPSGDAWVIDAQPDDAVRAGPLRFDVLAGLVRTEAEVDPASVPAEQRLEGLEVDLYAGRQVVCRIALGPLALSGHAEWQSFDRVSLDLPGPPDAPEPTDEELQRASTRLAPRWLVARLPDDPSCTGATWGRLARLPPPAFAEELPSPALDAPFETLIGTAAWETHQAAFVEHEQNAMQWGHTPTGGTWTDDPSTVRRGRAFRFRGQEHVLVGIEGGEPCSFRALLRGLFRRSARGHEMLWNDEGLDVEGLLVDLDVDGRLELVTPFLAGTLEGDAPWYWTDTRAAHHGCGC
jgi:hypothetical protein